MDEAGRSTKPPIITAPPGLDAEPEGKAVSTANPAPAAPAEPKTTDKLSGKSAGSGWFADRADEDTKPAPAVQGSDRKPSFTPTVSTPVQQPAAAPVPVPVPGPQASPYSQPGYQRPDWSQPAPSHAAPTTTAEPGTNGHQQANGFGSTASTAASTATSAVTGAAAGLAGSVTSVWHRGGPGDDKNAKADKGRKQRKSRKATKRQAVLTLARVEPWSVMKFSFISSVVAFIILFVAVAVLYMVLSALGAFDSIQHFVTTLTSSKGTAGTNITHWFSASLILGYTAMLGALNIVLITAMSTVGSVIYNLIAKTIGGIEVTLRETD